MNLRSRIEKIERQVQLQLQEDEGPCAAAERLLATPLDELVPGEPTLDPHNLWFYYVIPLAYLSFSRERPEYYTQADLKEWRARKRHAESLVEVLEEQGCTYDVRARAEGSIRTWVNAVRYQFTGEQKDQIPL